MTTALVSLLTGRNVRAEVGMTGEVSLTGRVLPIGGVKQKLLAAQRAGLTEVFLPQRNEPDLDDVPADVLADVAVHLVSDVREILASALEPAGERPRLPPEPWRSLARCPRPPAPSHPLHPPQKLPKLVLAPETSELLRFSGASAWRRAGVGG